MRSLLILLTLALPASAQDQWKWPDEPKNLQVLPKDTTGAKLGAVMRGFTRSLGVRCTYCHVGEEGKPLSTYDFASDANPNKDRAREMIRIPVDDVRVVLDESVAPRDGDEQRAQPNQTRLRQAGAHTFVLA